jgi:homoserine kinase
MGGIVVGVMTRRGLEYVKLKTETFKELKFAVMIPNFPLPTKKARGVLPNTISTKDAVFNISRVALMIAAITAGDFDKLGTAMDDKLHQPYRAKFIPEMEKVFAFSRECGAKGVFLSGAGPSVMAVYTSDSFADKMPECLKELKGDWEMRLLEPDDEGAVIGLH